MAEEQQQGYNHIPFNETSAVNGALVGVPTQDAEDLTYLCGTLRIVKDDSADVPTYWTDDKRVRAVHQVTIKGSTVWCKGDGTVLSCYPPLDGIVTTGEKATETICSYFGIEHLPKIGESINFQLSTFNSQLEENSQCSIFNSQLEENSQFSTFNSQLLLYRLPSSSRAYPLSFDKKVEAYRQMFTAMGV